MSTDQKEKDNLKRKMEKDWKGHEKKEVMDIMQDEGFNFIINKENVK